MTVSAFIPYTKAYMDRHLDELAANTIIAAAENLRGLDGSMQYVKELQQFNENGYPRFGMIYIDYKTQKRILKDSAYEFKKIIEGN